MRILIIGYSKIVQKRILPALMKMPNISSVDIASRSSVSEVCLDNKAGQVFADYQQALSKSRADLVYISVVNSAHAEWVEKSLKRGLHVIVDKPAFIRIEDALRLAELAEKSNLCLAESTVYAYHPQIQLAHDVLMKASTEPFNLTATFSFPPLNSDNFRYKKELGGGALWDLGPYAASLGRVFFNEEPREIFCQICARDEKSNIDTSFSVLAVYSKGRSMLGHFGFNTEYRNHLNILGTDVSIDIDPVFTTLPMAENELRVRQHNRSTNLKVPKADNFLIFMQKVTDAIASGKYNMFAQNLLTDASVLNRVRKASGED